MVLRMSDIAKKLGVSRTTVSRVLSGKAAQFRIAARTAERVAQMAREQGYRPSVLARGLRTAFSRSIGLVVSDISNPFFANIAWAVEQAAELAGFATLVGSSNENLVRERAYIEDLRSRGADGLIVAAAGPDYDHLEKLRTEGYPFVLLDRTFGELDCDVVAVDNRTAARQLCEALLDRGARRVAFIGGRLETSTGLGRLEGYRAALRGRRIPFDNALCLRGDFSVESGQAGAEKLLRLPAPPDAIVCANNKLLIGCLDRLAGAPREPWAKMPVASFDEVPLLKYLGRPLLIASQPERKMGQRAAELLIARVLSGPPGSPRMNRPYQHDLLAVEQKGFGW